MIAVDNQTILADDEHAPEIIATIDKATSGQLNGLMNKLVERAHVAAVMSEMRQRKIHAAMKTLETKVAEGIGEWICRIDRFQFLWQQKMHGVDCWWDPDFQKAFLRDNPSYRLRYHAKNYVHGWSKEAA